MKLASSLLKSTYKTIYSAAKSTSKYVKSYVTGNNKTNKTLISWTSMI